MRKGKEMGVIDYRRNSRARARAFDVTSERSFDHGADDGTYTLRLQNNPASRYPHAAPKKFVSTAAKRTKKPERVVCRTIGIFCVWCGR